jgi:hypothetical protein
MKMKKKDLRKALKLPDCYDDTESPPAMYTGELVAQGYPACVNLVALTVGDRFDLKFTTRDATDLTSARDPYPSVEYVRADVVADMLKRKERSRK